MSIHGPGMAKFYRDHLEDLDPPSAKDLANRCARNPELRGDLLNSGNSEEDVDALMVVIAQIKSPPGEILRAEWDEFSRATTDGVEPHDIRPEEHALTPRWRSGLGELDDITGGRYGVTVVAGAKKLGKSMIGIGMACETAMDGACVVYLNAEIPKVQLANRILRYCEGAIPQQIAENFHPIMVSPGATLDRIRQLIGEAIDPSAEHLLVVVDSINSVSEALGDNDYFKSIREVANMVAIPRKHTEGRISGILVSETNRDGGAKGGKLEYLADLILLLKKTDDGPDFASIEIDASRESSLGDNFGQLGIFRRDFYRGRFQWVNN